MREYARGTDKAAVKAALVLIWTSQHLDNLWRLEAHLGERANAVRAVPSDEGTLRRLRPALSGRLRL